MTLLAQPHRQILLKQNKKRSFDGRHPWILEHSIHQPGSDPRLGEIVDLVREDGKFVGRGLYNPHSRIRVRLYTWDSSEELTPAFFQSRIDRAVEHRVRMTATNGDSLRIVFSEADQISGLVVDKYGEHLVMQLTSGALLPFVEPMAQRLFDLYRPLSISLQLDEKTAKSEGVEPQSRYLVGAAPAEPVQIEENQLRWLVDLQGGQKTGYYLDQRNNRMAAAAWIPQGARVLDVCTYVGGFALTIAKHSPQSTIVAVDSSEKALLMANQHATLNGLDGRVDWVQADFFQFLSDEVDHGAVYDAIILDPPRLASSRDNMERALAAYHRLNFLAVKLLRPGGTLVTCSCSGRVSREDFVQMLRGVGQRTRREIQVLENRGAAPDHPHALNCPESDYLKCVIARVV